MASQQGRVVWHDLNTTDLDGAKRFYGELFAWRIQSEGGWSLIYSGDDPHNHFGSVIAIDKSRPMPPCWIPYLTVENIDQAIGAVQKAGGKMHMPKSSAGKTGDFAYAADPQGATFCLWQYASEGHPKAEVDATPPPGSFCWDELLTSDPTAAEKFYTQVFGYTTEHMEMPDMRYTLFQRNVMRPDGKPRQAAGMMKMPPGVPHPFWLSYVSVADCDQSTEKAKKLGGTITVPPMNIPNVGRFATMLDPAMAPIAILGPNK
jgi:uncharacterized protein